MSGTITVIRSAARVRPSARAPESAFGVDPENLILRSVGTFGWAKKGRTTAFANSNGGLLHLAIVFHGRPGALCVLAGIRVVSV